MRHVSRWLVMVAISTVACKSPGSDGSKTDEMRAPTPVPTRLDARVADAQPRAAVDLGLAGASGRYGPGVRSIALSGERVLWSTLADDGTVTIRGVPRSGA
jgi:hypothetical protein